MMPPSRATPPGSVPCVTGNCSKENNLMAWLDLFRTAFRNVAANKLRAALTMLGVVIGVASVIAMLALGNGARAAVDATFQFLGANQIQLGQRFAMQAGSFKPMGKILAYSDGLELLDAAPL